MAKNGAKTGRYDLRVVILRRVLGTAADNNEQPATFTEPAAGSGEYFACRDSLNAGETIVQGLNQSTGTMRLRIKGRAIAVSYQDRLKVKHTGEMFNVVGVARENADTVLIVDRMHPQTVAQ